MKILLLYYSPWWNATAYYGITLARGLQDAGHDVWLGTPDSAPAARKATTKRIKTFTIKLQTLNPAALLCELWRLTRFVRHEKIDVINTLSPQGHLFHFLGTKFFGLDVPLVRTCCDERKPKRSPFNRYLYSRCTSWLIFSCRSNFERYYNILRFPPQKTSVIYAGLDLTEFDRDKPPSCLRAQFAIPRNTPVVGIVARLSPEKGHKHFLHVAAKVAAKSCPVRFVVVGKEEQLSIPALQKLAATLGIGDKVTFTGFLDDPRGVISEFTVAVIASRFSETISRAALEYMASSKPVVATAVNVLAEIVHPGVTGGIYDVDDVNGMAEGIVELLKCPEKNLTWGRRGRQEVEEKYTVGRLVEETVNVYKKIVSERKQRV